MKKRISLVCFAAVFAALFGTDNPQASAQVGPLGRLGSQANQPDTFRRVAADVQVGVPGRVWIETNFADNGLGFTGSYATIGGKTRLFEDAWDGRWLSEARLHHSIEDDGGFFANVGLERVFSIDAAGADFLVGAWYDFDGDQQGNFGNDFSQVGVNAAIKTRRWDLIGNGYFPVGITDRVSGDPESGSLFFGNNIQLQPGIDSALTGFDVTLRLKPKQLAFVNGSFELGAYGYSSDLVNSFGGGRVRLGMQTRRGLSVTVEVNHDDRFETTGVLGLGYSFGAGGAIGGEYSRLGRDLEQTVRNDHIVRFNQDVVLAIDPDTGAPYNVVHVNNTADGTIANGTKELPFDELLDAQFASNPGDIIYVNVGDGTTRLYDQGIVLQDDQLLLSTGGQVILPTANQGLVELFPAGGIGATISNPGGFDVVRLADRNFIAGINIDASGATNGISGNGIEAAEIQSTNISGATQDGILVTNSTGDWSLANVNSSLNGRDGIHLNGFASDQVTLTSTTTNTNSRHGIFLENDFNPSGSIDIVGANSSGNTINGILVANGDGNLNVIDSIVDNNTTGGIRTFNYTNNTPGDRTFIGTTDGGVSSVSGNRVGANLEFELDGDGLTQDILVTGLTINDGGRGIVGETDGQNTVMNIGIIDTVSINDNDNEGILLTANGGSIINTTINSTTAVPLQIVDNGIIGGAAISLNAVGINNGIAASQVNSNIDNVFIQLPGNSAGGDGIEINSTGNAVVTSTINDVEVLRIIMGDTTVPNNFNVNESGTLVGGDFGIDLNFANNGAGDINRVEITDVLIETDNGISINTFQDTFSDVSISDSVVQAVGPRASDRDDGLDDPTMINFGGVGIQITTFGDDFDASVDNLTSVTIERTLVQDFAGPFTTGLGDFGFNGLFEALPGAGIDVAAFGDSNLLLVANSNQLLNNGAGFNFDDDNDGFFFDQPVEFTEEPDRVLFYDAFRINAFDDSVISTRIVGNFFQDNFERAISLDTYDTATINAQVLANAFDNNDRGDDPVRETFRTFPTGLDDDFNPGPLAESQIFDFEAVNNEEFFQRLYESPLAIDPMSGDIIDDFPFDAMGDPDGNDIADLSFNDPSADFVFTDTLDPGFADINLDLSGNAFEHGIVLENFATPPGEFVLAGTPTTAGGFTFFDFGTANPITPGTLGFADALITNEELLFEANGF